MSKYNKEFKLKRREKFQIGDQVRIKKTEIEMQSKYGKLYEKEGVIIGIHINDSYQVKEDKTGRVLKISHQNLVKNLPLNDRRRNEGHGERDDNGTEYQDNDEEFELSTKKDADNGYQSRA